MKWDASEHSANATGEYLFHQLIPYIGNKRKLLDLVQRSIQDSRITPDTHRFVDLFAGTGVVSRLAKQLGYAVLANDWEPYSEIINQCYLEIDAPPIYWDGQTYEQVLAELNELPPREDWVSKHLCPKDDQNYDITRDRLFYTRHNGTKIDAIRHQIELWEKSGKLSAHQKAALLAPLLYQCCYNSNTSGVFKGFHNGWGGQTGTALYRIKGDLNLRPALFIDNGKKSIVTREDAQIVAERLKADSKTHNFIYIDPPYNQHPYAANYHVLNSVVLWDKPPLSSKITSRGDKAAIRQDWKTHRRSAYNYVSQATDAYKLLLQTLPNGSFAATSYSTDGMIPIRDMIESNIQRGDVRVFTKAYKRYRVSSQRYSQKPLNIEFILLTELGAKPNEKASDLADLILKQEREALGG